MRFLLSILSICAALMFASPLLAENTAPVDAKRLAAARDLLEVTGVTKQMDGMVAAISRGFARGANADSSADGKKLSDQFGASMKKLLEYKDQMINDFAELYAETFTAEEMKAVADFYRTGAGAKFIAKTPELMQKGAAIGIKYSEKIAKEMQSAPPPAAAPAPADPK